jgi:iron complex transport system permease protein
VGTVLAVVTARSLDLLSMGDDTAQGLGIRLGRERVLVVASATLLTAAAVTVAGPVTFVGLLVPHLARPVVGPAHRWLLPLSGLLGAALLLASDVIGRVLLRPAELQAGVVTAFVGAPFLVWLVRRLRTRVEVGA